MGVFDQAARFAAQADPSAVVARVSVGAQLSLVFREWLDTRSLPLPGGPDRIADLVAALDGPEGPTLLVFEFQNEHDPDKLDVTLEETGILRCRVRHGEDRKGKYRVLTALVYLQDRCPEEVLDMTVASGHGTRHAPLIWNVAEDTAVAALEASASGQVSWGMLFWVPLMTGAQEEGVIARWREVVEQLVPDRRARGNLAAIVLVLAELVNRRIEWKRGLEGFEMTESQVVNEWISQGEAKGALKTRRQYLLELLESRFPKPLPQDVTRLIQQQDSLEVLHEWFTGALHSSSFDEFLTVLKQ